MTNIKRINEQINSEEKLDTILLTNNEVTELSKIPIEFGLWLDDRRKTTKFRLSKSNIDLFKAFYKEYNLYNNKKIVIYQ
jgi:hypothetical protein